MTFPDKKFADVGSFAGAYFAQITTAAASIDRGKLEQAADILTKIYNSSGGFLEEGFEF